jgi:hypothetical protein
MSNLVVVGFDELHKAEEVRLKLQKLQGANTCWILRTWSSLKNILIVLLLGFVTSCAQSISFAPTPAAVSYRISNFSRSSLRVVVNDFRGERENSDTLVAAIRSEIENSLLGPASDRQYLLTVDVIEHRSFFTLGNWHATTRLKWRIERSSGQMIKDGIAVGEGHRSNMTGYFTAAAVSQDSFNAAMADLLSSISAVRSV